MGSNVRQLRLLRVGVVLAAVAGAAVLVSAALGSSFDGENGRIAFYVNAGDGKPGYIATANSNGSGKTRVSMPDAKTDQGDFSPRFSPNGTEVVFVRNASKVGYNKLQIWLADASGVWQHQVELTGMPSNTYPNAPTFTADGKHIVFVIDTINAPKGLGEVSVKGGKVTQLTTGDDWQPSVSPDGTKIAFMRGYSLVVTDIHGGNPQTLYTEPPSASSIDLPDWSHDGSQIAFEQLNSSTSVWDIWRIASDGSDNGNATNLTNGTTMSYVNPSYSPDGTEIAVTAIDNSSYSSTIDVMSAGGGSPTAIITPTKGFVAGPDWGVKAPPPAVTKVSPLSGAKGVSDKATVAATWNESLSSKSIVVKDAVGKAVEGKTTCNAECTVVTFVPAAPLKGKTSYSAIAMGKNVYGSAHKKWKFETK